MNYDKYAEWSLEYSSISKIWNQYAEMFQENLHGYFNGAYSSFEKDDIHNSFSFTLFGHDCFVRLISKIDRYLFEYEISRQNKEPVVRTFEGSSHLNFQVNANTFCLKINENDRHKFSFTGVVDALISEMKKDLPGVKAKKEG
tara:strand:+ start:5873 stop:6301 length:429 start_codon:yes stop_codon:yes gene_type:complete